MAERSSMNKILNWKLGQIKQLSNKLKEVLDSFVSKITGSAQMWIGRSEDHNQQGCLEVSTQLDQAMLILTETISEIESKLASQLLNAGTLETTLKSATHLSSQINVGSQAMDQPLISLQERMHSLESVAGSVQAGLDRCRKQIGSVEGMKANLENLASQVEVITNDKSVQQIQREIEYYKSKEVARMQSFEEQLLKIENILSTTDCRLKDLGVLSNSLTDKHKKVCDRSSNFDHRLSDLEKKSEIIDDKVMIKFTEVEAEIKQVKLQNDGVIADSAMGSNFREIQEKLTTMETKISNITDNHLRSFDARLQLIEEGKKALPKIENKEVEEADNALAAGIKEIQPRRSFIGFIASRVSNYTRSGDRCFMKFDIHALSSDTLFDETTGQFTAPVDGTYLLIFIQKHDITHSRAFTIKLFHSDKTANKIKCVCTTYTDEHCSFCVGRKWVVMRAGDTLFLYFHREHGVEIPVFCCVLTG